MTLQPQTAADSELGRQGRWSAIQCQGSHAMHLAGQRIDFRGVRGRALLRDTVSKRRAHRHVEGPKTRQRHACAFVNFGAACFMLLSYHRVAKHRQRRQQQRQQQRRRRWQQQQQQQQRWRGWHGLWGVQRVQGAASMRVRWSRRCLVVNGQVSSAGGESMC